MLNANHSCSIIMPAYNSGSFITNSVDSIKRQTYSNWNLIISDDGSTQEYFDKISSISDHDIRISVIGDGVNRGAAEARNRALDLAQGRYIAFLDSDDLWKPEKLERQIAFMQKHDLAFTFSSYDRIDEEGKFINTHYVDTAVTYHDLLKSCVIGCLTAVYDTEKVGKVYMPDHRGAEDFGLWLRILKKVDRAVPLPESLAQYRVRSGSVSANKLKAAKYTWSVYRDVEKLGLLPASYYFAHYALSGVTNTYIRPKLARRTK